MFKRIISLCLCLIIVFSFASCTMGSSNNDVTTDLTVDEQIAQSVLQYPEKNEDFRYNKYTYYVAITQCLSLKSNITIPDTIDNLPVYAIADEAFEDQTTIKTVTISDSVIQIGNDAFRGCTQLTSVKLPSSIETIGSGCFEGCDSLKTIQIPNTLAEIPANFCSSCDSLSYITIDERDLLSVDEKTGVETYTPDRVIDDSAFSNCEALNYVWIPEATTFSNANPFTNSIENLTIYGYAQSDAASYAANNFVDFVLINNKSQLTEFKSVASTASKTQIISLDDTYRGDNLDIQIENVYIVRNNIDYSLTTIDGDAVTTKDYTYTPKTNSVVAIFGLKVKNNTSREIELSSLDASITVDSYSARFASFGHLENSTLSKYSAPSYSEIAAGETKYLYFAAIINSEWNQIDINFGNFTELLNYEFIIKSTDKITYVGSADSALDADTETTTAASTSDINSAEQTTVAVDTSETTTVEDASGVTESTVATTAESTSVAG